MVSHLAICPEFPTNLELVLNLKTAKESGCRPRSLPAPMRVIE
jgi:hypothetical protein